MKEIQVMGDRLNPDRISVGTAGSYHEMLKFVFSEEWAGLLIKAVFYPVRGKPVEADWFGVPIKVPPEVMRYSGIAKYVVSGYIIKNGKVEEKIITVPGILDVESTLKDEGGESIPQTATVYEQLRSQMQGDIGSAIRGALDGEPERFRGEKGEAATVMVMATETLSPGRDAYVRNYGDSTNVRLLFAIPKGETGDPGVLLLEDGKSIDDADIPDDVSVVVVPTGESLQILDGKDGKDGEGFKILGFYDTSDELEAEVFYPSAGDAYGIGTEPPYDILVYDGNTHKWVNIGAMSGVPGKSAYETWLELGNEGTESDFIASLKGQDGADGKDGEDGEDGLNGKNGLNGAEGVGIADVAFHESSVGGEAGQAGAVDTYKITLSNGNTIYFDIKNGRDGADGGVTIETSVTEGGENAVSGGAVYAYVAALIGADYSAEADDMDSLIGGETTE